MDDGRQWCEVECVCGDGSDVGRNFDGPVASGSQEQELHPAWGDSRVCKSLEFAF